MRPDRSVEVLRNAAGLLSVLACLVAATAAAGDNRNAATWYGKAMEKATPLSEAEWRALGAYQADPSQPPSPEVRQLLARMKPVFDLTRRGCRQEYADWNLDYSQGFEMLLPHLAEMRTIARLMQAEALVQLHDGRPGAAAEEIAAIYRLSGHFGDDRTLISSLVGQAVFKCADVASQAGLDHAAFGPGESAALLRGLKPLEPVDPFEMGEAVAMEQTLVLGYLDSRADDPQQRARMAEVMGVVAEDEESSKWLLGASDEQFDAALDQYDQSMNLMVEAFTGQDRAAGRAEIEKLEKEISAGEYGPLAAMFIPTFSKVFDKMVESEQQLADRVQVLQGLARAKVHPEEEANAAIFYARGIELIRQMDKARFDAVCGYAAGERGERDDLAARALQAAQDILDLFREGSMKRRCDFAFLRPGRSLRLCPDYVGGMRDAVRLLHADAMRLLDAGESAAAADRLAISYRVVGHLTGDDMLLSAPLAHRTFERANEIARSALQNDRFDADHRATLRNAAERISAKDPFGYINSVVASRDRIILRYRGRWTQTPEERRRIKTIIAAIEQWNGDQILYYLTVHDTLARADEQEEEADPSSARLDPLTRLDDVISLPALEQARLTVGRVAPRLARDDINIFDEGAWEGIARIVERMRSARRDLRRGLEMLQPVGGEAQRH